VIFVEFGLLNSLAQAARLFNIPCARVGLAVKSSTSYLAAATPPPLPR
jgi:hypothetical protein